MNGTEPFKKGNTCYFRYIFLIICLNFAVASVAFSQDTVDAQRFSGESTIGNARQMLLQGNVVDAIIIYSQVFDEDTTNTSNLLEYTYALAVGGLYDASLRYLDLILINGKKTPEFYYYTSQIFALMGYTDLADGFMTLNKTNEIPAWLSEKAANIQNNFARQNKKVIINVGQDLNEEYKLANKMAAQNCNLQSIIMFRDIMNEFPDDYILYTGYSIPLEKAGLLNLSVKAMETSIELYEKKPEDPSVLKNLGNRLNELQTKITAAKATKFLESPKEVFNPKMLMYLGATLGASSSINAKLGYFLTSTLNGSVDVGIGGGSGVNFVITSYSIHYTKLYENQKRFHGYYLFSLFNSSSVIFSISSSSSIPRLFCLANRITSYNVCYTKLLRAHGLPTPKKMLR